VGVDISTRVYGGHVVVALRGELDIADAARAAAAVTAVTHGGQRVIVDLSALGFIDCSALGALLGVQRLARQAGGDVLLAAPQERVLRLLALTGLVDVFCVHASVAAAVASGGGSRARYAVRRPVVRAAGPGKAAALATGTR
jgi:anti-sigma B factor antagonist